MGWQGALRRRTHPPAFADDSGCHRCAPERFPDETPYVYEPLAGETEANRFNEETRRTMLHNYNRRDLGI